MALMPRPSQLLTDVGDGHIVTTESAGWRFLSFRTERLCSGSPAVRSSGDNEIALIPLAGVLEVEALGQLWRIGGRKNVFDGLPDALYLPVGTHYRITSRGGPARLATCGAKATTRFPALHITPADYEVELLSAGPASRQAVPLIPPEFPAERLIVVEVWTPAGNWSSDAPHKHDDHRRAEETALEKTFFFQLSDPWRGLGLSRHFGGADGADRNLTVRHDDVLLVESGYHTVAAFPGYDMYYLSAVAGEARGLSDAEDPAHRRVRQSWRRSPLDSRTSASARPVAGARAA
jgi:5-deoxy-glucuronate isomerase